MILFGLRLLSVFRTGHLTGPLPWPFLLIGTVAAGLSAPIFAPTRRTRSVFNMVLLLLFQALERQRPMFRSARARARGVVRADRKLH